VFVLRATSGSFMASDANHALAFSTLSNWTIASRLGGVPSSPITESERASTLPPPAATAPGIPLLPATSAAKSLTSLKSAVRGTCVISLPFADADLVALSRGGLADLGGYAVQTGSQLATSEANAAVHFTQQFTSAILVFALIALVVACIVIYNTFTILITQRGRELALLRCVGASRGQVFRSTLLESAIVGLIASAAGVLAGLGLGWGLQRLFAGFGAGVPSGPVVLPPSAVVISMAAGLVVTVAAAVIPARSATRVAPTISARCNSPPTRGNSQIARKSPWPEVCETIAPQG